MLDCCQRVFRRDDQHEAVGAKRQGLETGDLHGGGDDPDIRGAVGYGGDDLVTEPLLQIDVHLRVGSEEIAERFGQELGQRIGIRQQTNLSLDALGILRELAVHALRLLQQHARVMNEGAAGRRRLHTLALAVQQGSS